jgi:eukaryotic-like serine/threonine-protein kinase
MPDTNPQETLATNVSADRTNRSATATDMPHQLDARVYHLLEELGKGGMGEVYRTGDPALDRDLAIKIMKVQYNGIPEAEGRFLREARVTGLLQHPSIVPVHNLGRLPDGRLHYTMRLVRGRTFADILKDEAGQPERLPSLVGIFEKICQAVAYAHSKQVIHRDLKPANVMVGSFGEVQVMDWGLAKVLSAPTEPGGGEPRRENGEHLDLSRGVGCIVGPDAGREQHGHASIHVAGTSAGRMGHGGRTRRRVRPGVDPV